MKKILAMILALVMCFSLVACGGGNDDAQAEDGAAKIKIGMVTDTGGINDQSFNQSTWEGLSQLPTDEYEIAHLVSKTDADYDTNIQTFIDDGYDLILCTGFKLAEATKKAAEANPDQKFAIIDDASIDLPNVACLMFAQEQASYLVGIVAGMASESGVVGYVQGMVSENMNLFGIGFIEGVLSVNPDAEVLQYNANSFGDVAAGSAAVKNFVTKGADVVYHAAGGTGAGVITGCQENGIYAIGVDADQSYLAPETVITSAMKRVDIAAQDISKAVKEGTFKGGITMYDINNGGVDVAPTQDLLTDDMIAAVEAAKAGLQDGSIVVSTTSADCPAFILQ
jgi:basic membrane protein A